MVSKTGVRMKCIRQHTVYPHPSHSIRAPTLYILLSTHTSGLLLSHPTGVGHQAMPGVNRSCTVPYPREDKDKSTSSAARCMVSRALCLCGASSTIPGRGSGRRGPNCPRIRTGVTIQWFVATESDGTNRQHITAQRLLFSSQSFVVPSHDHVTSSGCYCCLRQPLRQDDQIRLPMWLKLTRMNKGPRPGTVRPPDKFRTPISISISIVPPRRSHPLVT
ncbi:hypothetical protein EDB84DRAFT_87829 [Lactarius hengduanensis]|nr:hypothetical protein EDB84DRAFT_87829 [Lactarius hengduanensis]